MGRKSVNSAVVPAICETIMSPFFSPKDLYGFVSTVFWSERWEKFSGMLWAIVLLHLLDLYRPYGSLQYTSSSMKPLKCDREMSHESTN